MYGRRHSSSLTLAVLAASLLATPSAKEAIEKAAKPESEFARQRRLKRERKEWPEPCEVQTAVTYDPKDGRKQFGPPRSVNQRQHIPKQHHRPRGRGR